MFTVLDIRGTAYLLCQSLSKWQAGNIGQYVNARVLSTNYLIMMQKKMLIFFLIL